MADQLLRILPAVPDDAEVLRKFLRDYYIQDSPLNKCLKVSPCVEIEDFGVNLLNQGISFKAVNYRNEIVGILLNTINSRENPLISDAWKSSTNEQYKRSRTFFVTLETRYNVLEQFPECSAVFKVVIMAVSPECRGAGIGTALMKSTLELVATLAMPLCYCICSSRFSGIVCEKAGFEAVHRYAYEDHVVDGHRPIRPEAPHTEAVVYVRKM